VKRRIWIVTLFESYFEPLINCGVVGQALRGERVDSENPLHLELNLVNPRNFCQDNWKGVDDAPFGGGPGMVMRADVLKNTLVEGILKPGAYDDLDKLWIIYPSPRGQVWSDQAARQFAAEFFNPQSSKNLDLVFICGRYEGVDERFLAKYVNQFFSLGDFVLSGAELAAMAFLDSSLRFCSGVLGNKLSSEHESFATSLLESPQYTRPREFEGMEVPEILLSGHHEKIIEYQKNEAIKLTKQLRPEMYQEYKAKYEK
jgi:tRNA (guanine37-N1)-methyltransferase